MHSCTAASKASPQTATISTSPPPLITPTDSPSPSPLTLSNSTSSTTTTATTVTTGSATPATRSRRVPLPHHHHRLVLCISRPSRRSRPLRSPSSPISPVGFALPPPIARRSSATSPSPLVSSYSPSSIPTRTRTKSRAHPAYHPYMMATPATSPAPTPLAPRARAASRRATLLSPLSTTASSGPSRSLDPTGTLGPVAIEIVPGVYLGDLAAAESAGVLTTLGITHVLSAMRGAVRLPLSPHTTHLQFAIEDNPFAELAAHLPEATRFVDDALASAPNARVLIHCVQGVSRSAAIVAAFLVARYGWTVERAVAHVKSCRPAADPNFGFVKQIGEYADSLQSSR